MKRTIAAVVASLLSFAALVSAARVTIPELVQRNAPNAVFLTHEEESLVLPFERITEMASLIVYGTVAPTKTYLSDDQYDLYTDYTVSGPHVILQRAVQRSQMPGIAASIIVKRWGGQTVINGVSVSAKDIDNDGRLDAAPEVILFLERDKEQTRYRLVSELYGVLVVRGGRIESPVTVPAYTRFNGMTVAQFESEVRRFNQ